MPPGYSRTSRVRPGVTSWLFGSRRFSRAIELRIVTRWLGPDQGRALDLAAGNGEFAVQLALRGLRVIAVDIDVDALRGARDSDTQDIKWIGGDATNLPFTDNSFDVVVCNSALEHVADEGRTVAEIRRVLKPGGRLILTTDSFPRRVSPWLRFMPADWRHEELRHAADLRQAIQERHRKHHRVVRFYDSATLIRSLEEHQFRVDAWQYYLNGPMSKAIFELHLIYTKLDFYNRLSRRLYPFFFPFTFPVFRRRGGYGLAVMASRADADGARLGPNP